MFNSVVLHRITEVTEVKNKKKKEKRREEITKE